MRQIARCSCCQEVQDRGYVCPNCGIVLTVEESKTEASTMRGLKYRLKRLVK